MGSPYRVRRIFKPVVVWVAKKFNKIGMLPNHVTVLMLLTSIAACITIIFTDLFWIFGILTFLTGIFDGVDGALARLSDKSTKFGAFFDSTLDRISEIMLFLGLFLNGHFFLFGEAFYQSIIILTVFSSLMISYVRSRAESMSDFDFDVGIFARSERLFMLFLICVLPFKIVYSIGIILLGIGVVSTLVYRTIVIGKVLKNPLTQKE
jgi:phosphatidylglycerophosphate synthase